MPVRPIALSPSSLNAFRACPRCFWMDVHGKGPPAAPFPSLPGGIDLIVKAYYDKYRSKGLPPLLKGKMSCALVGQQLADAFRRRVSHIDEQLGARLWGMMDDCFVDEKGFLIPMDNKTRGFPFKEAMDEELLDMYTFQLEAYAFLLEKNGHKVRDFGYLVYYIPEKTDEITHGIKFLAEPKKIALNAARVPRIFREAVATAKRAKPPAQHKDCEMCHWVAMVANLE